MKLLLLIPDLAYSEAARQVCQLARAFAPYPDKPQEELTVAVLGNHVPPALGLTRAGVAVQTLNRVGWFDLGALRRLRELVVNLAPDVIHLWGLPALRALALAIGRPAARLIVSNPLPPGVRRLGMLDRWLLSLAQRILVGSGAEADRCRRSGLPSERLEVVRPAVEAMAQPVGAFCGSPRLVCAGRMEPFEGFREALWAFDILRFVAPELRLQLIGDGPERPSLERFVGQTRLENLVDFNASVSDLPASLAAAAVVWVPGRTGAGVQVALEALAVGRPVVASRSPDLAEVVMDGETGCLVKPGDKVELVRQTQQLLQDPARRRQLGEAGKARVLRDFSIAALVRHVGEVYRDTAA